MIIYILGENQMIIFGRAFVRHPKSEGSYEVCLSVHPIVCSFTLFFLAHSFSLFLTSLGTIKPKIIWVYRIKRVKICPKKKGFRTFKKVALVDFARNNFKWTFYGILLSCVNHIQDPLISIISKSESVSNADKYLRK